MFEWFLRLFGLGKRPTDNEKNTVPTSAPSAEESPVSEPTPPDTTEAVFVETDAYGNKAYFQDEKSAEKYRAEQKRSQEQKVSSSASQPITKEWYKSVGQETEQPASKDTSSKSQAYKPNFQFTSHSTSSEESECFVKVQFPYSRNSYDYLCDDYTVRVGEWVSVPTPKGPKRAQVNEVFFNNINSMPLPKHRYKKIYSVLRGEDAPKTSRSRKTEAEKQTPEYEEKRCVNVIFETDGNEYSYLCEDELIDVDDFVIVPARGKEKIAKVVEVFEEIDPHWKSVIRKAYSWEIEEAQERFDEFYHFRKADREYEEENSYNSYNSYSSQNSYGSEAQEKRTFPTPEEFLEDPSLEFSFDVWVNATMMDRYNAEFDPRYWMLSCNKYSFEKDAERKREREKQAREEEREFWRQRLEEEYEDEEYAEEETEYDNHYEDEDEDEDKY